MKVKAQYRCKAPGRNGQPCGAILDEVVDLSPGASVTVRRVCKHHNEQYLLITWQADDHGNISVAQEQIVRRTTPARSNPDMGRNRIPGSAPGQHSHSAGKH